ncbi:MAG: hypothetical protein LBQ12_04310 [Deltaproteobacteria bacterium]|jgi:hypothetical protein|nr:hypothetical protein [Deltaproteobacteria bacterium]
MEIIPFLRTGKGKGLFAENMPTVAESLVNHMVPGNTILEKRLSKTVRVLASRTEKMGSQSKTKGACAERQRLNVAAESALRPKKLRAACSAGAATRTKKSRSGENRYPVLPNGTKKTRLFPVRKSAGRTVSG